jgi:hypothetical protein
MRRLLLNFVLIYFLAVALFFYLRYRNRGSGKKDK